MAAVHTTQTARGAVSGGLYERPSFTNFETASSMTSRHAAPWLYFATAVPHASTHAVDMDDPACTVDCLMVATRFSAVEIHEVIRLRLNTYPCAPDVR